MGSAGSSRTGDPPPPWALLKSTQNWADKTDWLAMKTARAEDIVRIHDAFKTFPPPVNKLVSPSQHGSKDDAIFNDPARKNHRNQAIPSASARAPSPQPSSQNGGRVGKAVPAFRVKRSSGSSDELADHIVPGKDRCPSHQLSRKSIKLHGSQLHLGEDFGRTVAGWQG